MKPGMIGFITFFFLGFFSASNSVASTCVNLLGSCDYYTCLETQEKCGKNSYYRDFGQKYCMKYQKEQHEYSKSGQEFLEHIRVCLQEKLEAESTATGKLPNCKKIKKFAIDTHKDCYTKYKFCELPDADRRKIKFTAKKEVFDFQVLKFAFWLEKACH